MKKSTLAWSSLAVMGCLSAAWATDNLPTGIQNLTQTLKSSKIDLPVSDALPGGGAIFLGGLSDEDNKKEIQMPVGALRDKSVLPEDIKGYAEQVAKIMSCADGRLLAGINEDGKPSCIPMPTTLRRWKSEDNGKHSIYFANSSSDGLPSVSVGGSNSSFADAGKAKGFAAAGDFSVGKALVLGQGLQIVGSTKAKTASLWSQYAHAQSTGDTMVLAVPGSFSFNDRSPGSNIKPVLVGSDDIASGGTRIGGNTKVDGSWYLTNEKRVNASRSAFVFAQMDKGGLITSKVKSSDGYKSARLKFDMPSLVIGGQTSTQNNETLNVKGDVNSVGGQGSFRFVEDSVETKGSINPSSNVPEECVALSLDDGGEVVLVNVCTGHD